ncbi:MAG: hypothetical protein QM809_09120 [Gordonia sp. (in: high G+C Gram-positive bacteria)]|uniref:hypothetical protein n=1 Tax=Gordonia sp. (in: high G+C Gram-positive bacteria) TaxID=84139 RepID=UPI0039E606F7
MNEPVTADVVFALASIDTEEIDPILTPKGRKLVDLAERTACAPDMRKPVRGTALGELVNKPISSNPELARTLRTGLELPRTGFSRPLMLSQTLQDDSTVLHESLRYLAEAQLSSNRVTATSYLTGDRATAERQELDAVLKFLTGLF